MGNIYYFNSTCELAVANGSFSYQPPLILQEMENDLASLPFLFGNETDFVLTENIPSAEFQQKMKLVGFDLPRFCNLAELEAMPDGSFDAIYPWGWSPAAHFKLKNLKEKCSDEFKISPVFEWKENHQLLFERSTALDFLTGILNDNPPDWFIRKEFAGKKVAGCEEIELLLDKHSPLVLKAPLSSSGRGIQILRKSKLNTSNKQWISGVLKQQKYLITEPFLDKLTDLSFQFRILSENRIEYLGFSLFETNTNGQYQGTYLHPELNRFVPDEETTLLRKMIESTAEILGHALEETNYMSDHRGFMGIDALIFRQGGKLKIQPCIEINSRMNMGILAMLLEKRIHPEATGKFELFYGKSGEFEHFTQEQQLRRTLEFKDGKLFSGFVPLTEPGGQNKFGAYISLGEAK